MVEEKLKMKKTRESTKQRIERILQKSGNNLHMQVVKILEEHGWMARLSSYYYDDTANKPREIDIIASREEKISDSFEEKTERFTPFLFIECKYFRDPVIFRLHTQTEEDSRQAIVVKGLDDEEVFPIETHHSFLRLKKVGKLYDTSVGQQSDLFNAITQPIKSLLFFKERDGARRSVYFPLVVFGGQSGTFYMEGDDLNETPHEVAHVGIHYSSRNLINNQLETNYFIITFIALNKFSDFLDSLDTNELKRIKDYLRFKIQYESK